MLLCVFVCSYATSDANAQQVTKTTNAIATTEIQIGMGLDDQWKVGFETPVYLQNLASNSGEEIEFEFTSVDGDGIDVTYKQQASADGQILVRHGRTNRSMRLKLLSDEEQVLLDRELTDAERGTALPVSQPWIVGIGENLELQEIVQKSARGGLPSVSVSSFADTTRLPIDRRAFAGVDLIVLATNNLTLLNGISEAQGNAIVEWVMNGGRIHIWLGGSAEEASKIEWLARLIPGKVIGIATEVDPAVLESFISTNQTSRLDLLTCAHLQLDKDSSTDLTLVSPDREKLPFLVRSAYGAGFVDTIAVDLNGESMLAWKDRRFLLERTFGPEFASSRQRNTNENVSFLGYNEMSGQIRASLDHFDAVNSGSISLLTALVLAFVLTIGGLDYFVVNRSLRKSTWTWLTLAIACCTILAVNQALTAAWKPKGVLINTVEIVDYIFDVGLVKGTAFTTQYSGSSAKFDLSAEAKSLVSPEFAASPAIEQPTIHAQTYLRWAGQPGTGLGGFDSRVRSDIGIPGYDLIYNNTSDSIQSEINGIGIPSAGTVSLQTSWEARCDEILQSNQLQNHPGSDLLEGSFTNPLDCELRNAIILYEAWAYPLPKSIPSGGTIQLSIADSPRDLSRQLQQRRVVDDKEQSVPWDPSERRKMSRLVELLTFYSAAGGRQYVGLELDYLKSFDLSNRLTRNRAVLLAEIDKTVLKWKARSKEQTVVTRDAYRSAYVRFLLPIEDR